MKCLLYHLPPSWKPSHPSPFTSENSTPSSHADILFPTAQALFICAFLVPLKSPPAWLLCLQGFTPFLFCPALAILSPREDSLISLSREARPATGRADRRAFHWNVHPWGQGTLFYSLPYSLGQEQCQVYIKCSINVCRRMGEANSKQGRSSKDRKECDVKEEWEKTQSSWREGGRLVQTGVER